MDRKRAKCTGTIGGGVTKTAKHTREVGVFVMYAPNACLRRA